MPNHVIVSTLNWSEQSLEKAVSTVAALEFGQIDLALHEGWAHVNPSELAARGAGGVMQEAERVRGMIERRGMKRVAAFNVGLGDASLEEQQERLRAVCDLAKALEVDVLTLMAARRSGERQGEHQEGTSLVAEAARLRTLLPLAQERGVQLTVQTHSQQVTATTDSTLGLCELVPGLGVTLDPSHLYAGPNKGEDYAAVLPLVKLVHLRDATLEHLQVPAGTGLVDFRWLVDRLHALKYDGQFAIKYVDRVPTTVVSEGSGDGPENVIRMRDVFVAAERAQGIIRAPAPPA